MDCLTTNQWLLESHIGWDKGFHSLMRFLVNKSIRDLLFQVDSAIRLMCVVVTTNNSFVENSRVVPI